MRNRLVSDELSVACERRVIDLGGGKEGLVDAQVAEDLLSLRRGNGALVAVTLLGDW